MSRLQTSTGIDWGHGSSMVCNATPLARRVPGRDLGGEEAFDGAGLLTS
ncbi:MAG: hypothetical protein M3519_06065 [Actinomycetota bacterium]|nr:hypothetical protein [Actinomycetota bacterium]